MKISEVASSLQIYAATVRVVLRFGSTTARTTITAENLSQARAMLMRIYGDSNVFGVSLLLLDEDEFAVR